jgi:hypothetical protein
MSVVRPPRSSAGQSAFGAVKFSGAAKASADVTLGEVSAIARSSLELPYEFIVTSFNFRCSLFLRLVVVFRTRSAGQTRSTSPTTLTVRVPRPNSASRRRRIFCRCWRDLTGWRSSSAIMYLCRWRTATECFLDHLYRRLRDLFGDIGRAICAGEFGNFVQSLGALHEVCEGSVQTGTRIH